LSSFLNMPADSRELLEGVPPEKNWKMAQYMGKMIFVNLVTAALVLPAEPTGAISRSMPWTAGLGGCPRIAIFFKIKACSKNYRRHIVDISRIIF